MAVLGEALRRDVDELRAPEFLEQPLAVRPPARSVVASWFCSAGEAPTPFAMNTIVSVFAQVQRKNATSHQT